MKKTHLLLAALLVAALIIPACTKSASPTSPDGGAAATNTVPATPVESVTVVVPAATATCTATLNLTPEIPVLTETATPFVTDTPYVEPTATITPTALAADAYEPDNDYTQASALAFETLRSASIYPVGDQDWISFTVAGGIKSVTVTAQSYGESGSFNLIYYNTDGTLYVTDGNNYGLFGQTCGGSLPGCLYTRNHVFTPGTYMVQVLDFMSMVSCAYDITFSEELLGAFVPTHTVTEINTPTVTPMLSPADTAQDTATYTTTQTPLPTATVTNTSTEAPTPDIYEFDDACSMAKYIAIGECQQRSLFTTDDDWVGLTITAHSIVTIETTGDSGGDTVMELDSTTCGGLITTDDDGGTNNYSKITRVLTPGIYGIKITSKNVLGGACYNYTLCVTAVLATETITQTVSPTSTTTLTYTATKTVTQTVTRTNSPTFTRTVSPTISETSTNAPTGTITPTWTITQTATHTATASITQTTTITPTYTNTAVPGTVWVQATGNGGFNRLLHTSEVFNSKMWILGGYDKDYNPYASTHYSTDGITWVTATASAAFAEKYRHSGVVYNGKMWVIAGNNWLSQTMNDVWSSPDGITWTKAVTNANFRERHSHASVVFDDGGGEKMWVIGGISKGSGILGTSEVFSSVDGATWVTKTTSAAFGTKLGHTGLVFDSGSGLKMWVITGSQSSSVTGQNDAWYSSDGINWTAATTSAAFAGRMYAAGYVYGGKMWLAAGSDSAGVTNDMWSSSDGVTWTQAGPVSANLNRANAGAVVFDNKMWMIGGGTGVNASEVWSTP